MSRQLHHSRLWYRHTDSNRETLGPKPSDFTKFAHAGIFAENSGPDPQGITLRQLSRLLQPWLVYSPYEAPGLIRTGVPKFCRPGTKPLIHGAIVRMFDRHCLFLKRFLPRFCSCPLRLRELNTINLFAGTFLARDYGIEPHPADLESAWLPLAHLVFCGSGESPTRTTFYSLNGFQDRIPLSTGRFQSG